MPGFTVPVDKGTIGSHGIKVNSVARYYYNYTWQIFQLFGGSVNDTALVNLKDTTLPTFTANQDSYVSSSLEYKWAKSVTWDDIKVSWYDTVGLGDVMKKWRASVWSPTNGLQVASEYKKRSQIDVYLPTGNNVITWCLVGSWPKVIRQGELTYTDSNVKIVEVTITYDWANDNIAEDDSKYEKTRPGIEDVKASCTTASSVGMPKVIISPSERN